LEKLNSELTKKTYSPSREKVARSNLDAY